MTHVASRSAARQKRHHSIRLHLAGTGARPRLAVFRSLNHIYAQVIDDAAGVRVTVKFALVVPLLPSVTVTSFTDRVGEAATTMSQVPSTPKPLFANSRMS